jgi:antitoxin (DNA-binding transcriptional repressor) of toxin-antitoxin stability system
MTVLELAEHPELAALATALRNGDVLEIVDHGRPVVCVAAMPRPAAARPRFTREMFAFRRAFTSPPAPVNEVVEMRQDERF